MKNAFADEVLALNRVSVDALPTETFDPVKSMNPTDCVPIPASPLEKLFFKILIS